MADKFESGQKLAAKWASALAEDSGLIPVTVIAQSAPGVYRCETTMGVDIVFKEEDLG
jgi:hypothetical protein